MLLGFPELPEDAASWSPWNLIWLHLAQALAGRRGLGKVGDTEPGFLCLERISCWTECLSDMLVGDMSLSLMTRETGLCPLCQAWRKATSSSGITCQPWQLLHLRSRPLASLGPPASLPFCGWTLQAVVSAHSPLFLEWVIFPQANSSNFQPLHTACDLWLRLVQPSGPVPPGSHLLSDCAEKTWEGRSWEHPCWPPFLPLFNASVSSPRRPGSCIPEEMDGLPPWRDWQLGSWG